MPRIKRKPKSVWAETPDPKADIKAVLESERNLFGPDTKETDDPFQFQVPERTKVYNPRFMRWEWSDTGRPVEGPTESRMKTRESSSARTIEEMKERGFQNGKYCGYPLRQVDSEYLRNFLGMADNNRSLFYRAVQDELRSRNEETS